jgi:hypothetical protein
MQIDVTTRRYSNKYEEENKQVFKSTVEWVYFTFLKNIKLIFFYLYFDDFIIPMLKIKNN